MKTLPTQALRDEHRELLPHVESLRVAADVIDEVPVAALREHVEEAYAFLAMHLVPHAIAEDRALYPLVARAMGAPAATATMSRDHVEVARLVRELSALRGRVTGIVLAPATAKALRRVLYSLYGLLRVHFAKEEEIYLPLLDERLTPAEARALVTAMERAAGDAKRHTLVAS